MQTEPLDWQRTGAAKILMSCQGPFRGCIVGDEMGLGKILTTIMACMAAKYQLNAKAAAFSLIVTTKTLVPQWFDEATLHFDKVCCSSQRGC